MLLYIGAILSLNMEFPQPNNTGYKFCYGILGIVAICLCVVALAYFILQLCRGLSRPSVRLSTINPVSSPSLSSDIGIAHNSSSSTPTGRISDFAALLSLNMKREGSYIFDKEQLEGKRLL